MKRLAILLLYVYLHLPLCYGQVNPGGTDGTHFRSAECAEDQDIVAYAVRADGRETGVERNPDSLRGVLDEAKLAEPKTKLLKSSLEACGLNNCLIIGGKEIDTNFALASRNLVEVDVLPAMGANVYDILRKDKLVLTKDAVTCLGERLK